MRGARKCSCLEARIIETVIAYRLESSSLESGIGVAKEHTSILSNLPMTNIPVRLETSSADLPSTICIEWLFRRIGGVAAWEGVRPVLSRRQCEYGRLKWTAE